MLFNKPARVGEERIKRVLVNDKMEFGTELKKLILSDVARILSEYLNIDREKADLVVNLKENGDYHINISIDASFIKNHGVVIS